MSEEITKYFDLRNSMKYQDDISCRVAVKGDTIIDFVDVNKVDDLNAGRMTFFSKPDEEYIGGSLKELEKDIKGFVDHDDKYFSKREISAKEFAVLKSIRNGEIDEEAKKLSDAKDRVRRKILEKNAKAASCEKPKSYRRLRKGMELSR